MHRTAVFWIRDGVLVDRMHVNPVAFAVASLEYAAPAALDQASLTTLVNFGFATSGISCLEKMRRFNDERMRLVTDVAEAGAYYNILAGEAASRCQYFEGACTLVRRLKAAGVLNFITSAVEQSALDVWAESDQGKQLVPHLTEVLGKRPNFEKGRQHFHHAREHYGVEKIYYVADAVAEIADGSKLAKLLSIVPVGFAHVISPAKVKLAYELVMDARKTLPTSTGHYSTRQHVLDENALCLPDKNTLTATLKAAGAAIVVDGNADEIIGNLTSHFEAVGILATT